jgi:hypothetical protein
MSESVLRGRQAQPEVVVIGAALTDSVLLDQSLCRVQRGQTIRNQITEVLTDVCCIVVAEDADAPRTHEGIVPE